MKINSFQKFLIVSSLFQSKLLFNYVMYLSHSYPFDINDKEMHCGNFPHEYRTPQYLTIYTSLIGCPLLKTILILKREKLKFASKTWNLSSP